MKLPSAATLKKYGLSEAEWVALYNKQGGLCAICGKVPTTGRLVVDHEHVRGWKKMPPERRKAFVRGLLCWFDNLHVVGRGMTRDKLRAALAYLENFSSPSGK